MSSGGGDRFRENLRHYLDAATSLGRSAPREIEHLVRELFDRETPSRERIDDSVEEVRARSWRAVDMLVELVRAEARRELEAAAKRRREELADLVDRGAKLFEDLIARERSTRHSDDAEGDVVVTALDSALTEAMPPQESAPRKKASPPRKVATPAKKVAAKKTASAKKALSPKKLAAKKAAPPKKVAAKAAAPVKTSGAKKVAAKKSARREG